jgi:RNA recognition motif-containing protein
MNVYVGNLPVDSTVDEVRQLFETHGTVNDVQLINDRFTKRSRGFGFVAMADDKEAGKAIAALNGTEFKGLVLQINAARPREGGGSRGGLGRREKRWLP